MKKIMYLVFIFLLFFVISSAKALNAEDISKKLKESEKNVVITAGGDVINIKDSTYVIEVTYKDDKINYTSNNLDIKKDAEWIKKVFLAILELKMADKNIIDEFKKADLTKEIENQIKETELPNSFVNIIKKTYGQDKTLLYHNEKLTNGANDNSYRFSGSRSDVVNNYVCLAPKKDVVEVFLGDVNNSGNFNGRDYYAFERWIAGTTILNDAQLLAADINKDGKVDEVDGTLLLNYLGSPTNELPNQTVIIPLSLEGANAYVIEDGELNAKGLYIQKQICLDDDLYRIIGIFDNQVKLVKNDYANSNLLGKNGAYASEDIDMKHVSFPGGYKKNYLGSLKNVNGYYYNSNKTSNKWEESDLNKVNLNTNFINNIGKDYANMIDEHKWLINSVDHPLNNTALNFYNSEIVQNKDKKTINSKIGLIYVSDYLYAIDKSLYNVEYGAAMWDSISSKGLNWLFMGIYEWLLTIDNSLQIPYHIDNMGTLDFMISIGDLSDSIAVRPTFYLKSNVCVDEGSGTKSNPYQLLLGELKYEIDLDVNTVIKKYTNEKVDNPNTGAKLSALIILIFLGAGLVIYQNTKKRNIFY